MGLDMYLHGRKTLASMGAAKRTEDGFEVNAVELEVGYWRKHPNLHGYIVQTFADGVDECQRIPLDKDALAKILAAVKADELPYTTGFFFGESRPEDKPATIDIIEKAIAWLDATPKDQPGSWEYREVFYRASW